MSVKAEILTLFEENRGRYFSGEEIAERLGVSRAAIWKAVKALQADGYAISGVPNKGYSLSKESDILSLQGIKKYLTEACSFIELEVVGKIGSTNTYAKARAQNGAREGFAVVAAQQTGGRGRSGKGFFSPPDTGVYLSLVLRPKNCTAEQAQQLTAMAAVAVCEAIEAVSDKKAEIKWVNDVYISGKKVCGILTEASFGLEDGALEYAVLGIGINAAVPQSGFPSDIKDTAGAVFASAVNDCKNRLAAEILNRLISWYQSSPNEALLSEYRRRCFVIGREIRLYRNGKVEAARAVGLNSRFQLLAKLKNGEVQALSSGEIGV